MSWASRVRHPSGEPPLQDVQKAAQNLAEQAGIAPGKTRVVFQTVADVALLGTVVISGLLATIHLYKSLFPRHKENHPVPEPAGGDRSPPPRRGARVTAPGEDHGPYEKRGARSR
ncbi:MAG TPA: hypothetical protein VMG10_32060 [Gemmataceae bacterium]|nr:hypothetical protein [Gemmataceae bacterium]